MQGTYFAESVIPLADHSKILARLEDGSPAVVASTYGKGKTLFTGTFLGLSTHQSPNVGNIRFIRNLVDWAAEAGIPGVDVELHTHEYTDFEINLRVLDVFLSWQPKILFPALP